MVNTALAISIVAVIIAAASLGYTNMSISGEASQLRNQLNAMEQNVASVQKDVSSLKSSLQTSLEEAKKQVAEREALLQTITPFDPTLVAAALKEGSLMIYSVRDQSDLVLLAQEFQKKFPGIKVGFFTAQSPELLARISAEQKAPQSTWDIYDNAGSPLGAAVEMGATQSYCSKQYVKDLFPVIDSKCQTIWNGATIPVIEYNKKLVKASDVAAVKTWEDVPAFAAKYKGQVLMDHPSRLGPFTTVLGELKTFWNNDAKWTKFLQDLAALNPRMFKSSGQIGRLVVSEEGSIGITGLLHDVLQGRETAGPMEFIPVTPVVVQPHGIVISKNAPHPNAAKLLAEFQLSPDGQEIFSRALRSPLRLGFAAKSSLSVLFPNVPGDQITGARNLEVLSTPADFSKKYLEPIFGPA